MRSLLLVTIVVVAIAIASASVVPKDFHSSHGHKKHAKESDREDSETTHAPVKAHATKSPHVAHKPPQGGPQPVIHPIPSHPPPHAEDGEAHHKPHASVAMPVIHPIASHPPPAEPTKPTEVVSQKEPEKKEE